MTDAEAVREALDDSMRCQGDDECRCSGHSAYRALDRMVAHIAVLEKWQSKTERTDDWQCRCENWNGVGEDSCVCGRVKPKA